MTTKPKPAPAAAPQSAIESNSELLKTILDHVADPIFVKDKHHRWIYGNRAFADIMGVDPTAYLDKSDYDFFPKEEADVFWKKDNEVFASDEVDINEEYLTDAHGSRHVLSTKKARVMLDGEPVLVGIIRDVTATKEIERLKDEFISMVSHELRTPLTSIRAALELLSSGKVGALPADIQKLLQIACRNSERLEHIINEILTFEKIGSGKVKLQVEPVHMQEFLTRGVDENRTYGQKYGITFSVSQMPSRPVYVLADANRLMQVLANLLSNAAKFSPVGGTVNVGLALKGPERVTLTVQDFGIGIPEKFRNHIFDRFAQADSSNTRKHEGTGLGLYITKKLVEAMDGAIRFESEEGRHTTFYVELPAAKAAPAGSGG